MVHHERGVALHQRAGGRGAVVVALRFQRQARQVEMLIFERVRQFVRQDDAVLRVVSGWPLKVNSSLLC